jgi:hypothetical protein
MAELMLPAFGNLIHRNLASIYQWKISVADAGAVIQESLLQGGHIGNDH